MHLSDIYFWLSISELDDLLTFLIAQRVPDLMTTDLECMCGYKFTCLADNADCTPLPVGTNPQFLLATCLIE